MKSMTGFGVGKAAVAGDASEPGFIVVEIRSLNHRFLDVRTRLPGELADLAFFLEQLARERLSRGRYDVGVRAEGAALPAPQVSMHRARAIYDALAELRDQVAPGTDLGVGALAAVPDLVGPLPSSASDAVRDALKSALESAVKQLDQMRATEGIALRREIEHRLDLARKHRAALADGALELAKSCQKRLLDRLARLDDDASLTLDPGRLETEVAILVDRSDVTEELARLDSHFVQFARLLDSQEPVGRRLDFLLQEIGREANTIGSKTQDATASHRVVDLKAEIERMREQVQNVE